MIPSSLLLLLLSTLPVSYGASETDPVAKPCSIHSPATGSFFDLRPLQMSLTGSKTQVASNESYHAKGYDYPANFTLNICAPVVEDINVVEGVSKQQWANVSAYYKNSRDEIISIGQENQELVFRGKRLSLNYTMGSPCPDLDEDGMPVERDALRRRKKTSSDDDDDDDEDEPKRKPKKSSQRRKSTFLSFICDTSPLLSTRPAISFLGAPDHCTYIFEVRSRYACAGATPTTDKGTLGPGGVFGVIFGIALLVYLIGGVVYQRNVMHQRGWRQLPNYSVWAGLFGFFSDMFVIFFSSCTQHVPSLNRIFGGRRGYHRVGSDDVRGGAGRGRGRSDDDENRLIDSYDEEWE